MILPFPLLRPRPTSLFAAILTAAFCFAAPRAQAQLPEVATGQKIVFLGDSITAEGVGGGGGGYCSLVIDGLNRQGKKLEMIVSGSAGNKSNQMLERLDRDVISKKPDWMTLSCGVNDVGHPVPLEDYKKNITAIVDKAQAAGIKVVILTATMVGEDPNNGSNQKLATYNDFLKELAKAKKTLIADLNSEMQLALKPAPGQAPAKGNQLTRDGVHMNAIGNQVMAAGVLKAFGLTNAQLEKIREAWLDLPSLVQINTSTSLTVREFLALRKLGSLQEKSADDFVRGETEKVIHALLAPAKKP